MPNLGRAALTPLLAVGLIASGCGSSSGPHPAAPPGPTVRVVMKSLDFTPVNAGARVGQRVMWTNNDSSPHNVTYVSGPRFTSSPRMPPGARFSIRLTAPGTIHYFCSLHPWMTATIVVSR